MRIVSGQFRGRHITAPANFDLRPTTDIAKEGLLNILHNIYDFDDVSMLDLFAGIGSISLEFASRGCEDIVAVEKNFKHAEFISNTVDKLGIKGMQVLKSDVRDYIKSSPRSFDIIFADPPYELVWIDKIPELLFNSNLVNDTTLVIVEHPISVNYHNFEYYTQTRKYGKVNFSMFEKPGSV